MGALVALAQDSAPLVNGPRITPFTNPFATLSTGRANFARTVPNLRFVANLPRTFARDFVPGLYEQARLSCSTSSVGEEEEIVGGEELSELRFLVLPSAEWAKLVATQERLVDRQPLLNLGEREKHPHLVLEERAMDLGMRVEERVEVLALPVIRRESLLREEWNDLCVPRQFVRRVEGGVGHEPPVDDTLPLVVPSVTRLTVLLDLRGFLFGVADRGGC